MNHCLDCGAELEGRADKKFCSDHCKSSYHYEHSKSKATSLFKTIDAQLKKTAACSNCTTKPEKQLSEKK